MPVKIRYVCRECRRTGVGGPTTCWCDHCGGELIQVGKKKTRRVARGG